MNLGKALADLQEKGLMEAINNRLHMGETPLSIIDELSTGMKIVGERFENQEYYLSELILAADIMGRVLSQLEPLLSTAETGKTKEKVIIGTAKGDIHDIGKKIVIAVLKGNGYEVYDLGEDVPPEAFVTKIQETGARIVGISALITTAFDGMKDTIEKIKSLSLGVKVMVGGGPVNEQVKDYVQADACGYDAMDAVRLVREWSGR